MVKIILPAALLGLVGAPAFAVTMPDDSKVERADKADAKAADKDAEADRK